MNNARQVTATKGMLVLLAFAWITGCSGLTLKPPAEKPDFITPLAAGPSAPPPQISQKLAIEAALATAREFERTGFDSEAIAQYLRAREQGSTDPEISWRLAVLHDRQGHLELARKEYDLAVNASPNNPDLQNDYGYFLYLQHDYTHAKKTLEQALALKPGHARAHTNLAMTLVALGESAAALVHFEKVVSPAEAQYNLGVLLAQQGRLAEARRALDAAKQLNPGFKRPEELVAQLEASRAR